MFTHSALLWFLPLAALPILLHLLSRWRVKTIELSTFRFLMEGAQHQRRRARLLEWLVLLLRTAFIVLIILAVSRPVASRLGNLFDANGNARHVAIVIDTSASMGLRAGGQSSLERAKAAAKALVDRLRPVDFVSVVDAGSASRPRVVFEGHAVEPSRIGALIDAMEAGPSFCNIADALAIATATPGGAAGSEIDRTAIIIITDGQRGTWEAIGNDPALQPFNDGNTGATPIILNVGATETTLNTGIVGDPPRDLRPIVGLPVRLTATITASGTDPAANARTGSTTLGVFLDDRLVDQLSISLAPGTTVTRTFTVTPTRAGLIKGRFALPSDALTADDEFLFCIDVRAKLNALAVIAPPAKDAKPADQPFIYLDAALTKSPRETAVGAGANPRSPELANAIDLGSIHHDILTDAQLANADVVILADAPIDPTRAAMLRRYVESGGGLLVLPGPRTNREVINAHLLANASGEAAGAAVPSSLSYAPPLGDPGNEATFRSIGVARVTHPVLSPFAPTGDDPASRPDYFDGIRLYRFHPILLPAPRAGINERQPATLLALANGTPVLVEARAGRGVIMLAGFPATPDWSNLPVSGHVFVPLMLRIAEHLRRESPVRLTPVTAPGQSAQLRIADPWRDAQAQLTDATGKPHTIALYRDDHERAGLLTPAERKGFYTIDIDPRTPAGQHTRTGFAVNTDARETDVAMIDEAAIREKLGANLRYLRSSADDPQLLGQLSDRREIWRGLIWLTFVVIAVEFVLATLRGRS